MPAAAAPGATCPMRRVLNPRSTRHSDGSHSRHPVRSHNLEEAAWTRPAPALRSPSMRCDSGRIALGRPPRPRFRPSSADRNAEKGAVEEEQPMPTAARALVLCGSVPSVCGTVLSLGRADPAVVGRLRRRGRRRRRSRRARWGRMAGYGRRSGLEQAEQDGNGERRTCVAAQGIPAGIIAIRSRGFRYSRRRRDRGPGSSPRSPKSTLTRPRAPVPGGGSVRSRGCHLRCPATSPTR